MNSIQLLYVNVITVVENRQKVTDGRKLNTKNNQN